MKMWKLYGQTDNMQLDHKIYAWVGEEYFSRENAFLLYDKYGDAFAHESLPRGQEIYNFCRFFLRYYYYTYILFYLFYV